MELNVIAEGVETKAQLNTLYETGCSCFQGYFVQRLVPVEEVTELYLKHWQPDLP